MSSTKQKLNAVKLAALVGDFGVAVPLVVGDFGGGAAGMSAGDAWVFVDTPVGTHAGAQLGAALAWALRRMATRLFVLTDDAAVAALMARRALAFRLPITAFVVDGRSLVPVAAAPLPIAAVASAQHLAFIETIDAGGADPVVEHDVVAGEVFGLEVCRVITDLDTNQARLEVGIGAHDRETFQLLHAHRPIVEALRSVVELVAAVRHETAVAHPLNRLAQERALRARLIADPGLIGATTMRATSPPIPRANVKDSVPAVGVALVDGREHVVVCSCGVNLELIPFAVDARQSLGIESLIVALPARDLLPILQLINEQLIVPAMVVPVHPAVA